MGHTDSRKSHLATIQRHRRCLTHAIPPPNTQTTGCSASPARTPSSGPSPRSPRPPPSSHGAQHDFILVWWLGPNRPNPIRHTPTPKHQNRPPTHILPRTMPTTQDETAPAAQEGDALGEVRQGEGHPEPQARADALGRGGAGVAAPLGVRPGEGRGRGHGHRGGQAGESLCVLGGWFVGSCLR